MDKKKVLEFFHNLPKSEADQFNQAFALYKASPGKNTATERTLNAGGYTKHNHGVLLYELQKIHDISDLEKRPPKVKIVEKEITMLEKLLLEENKLLLCGFYLNQKYPAVMHASIESLPLQLVDFLQSIRNRWDERPFTKTEEDSFDPTDEDLNNLVDAAKLPEDLEALCKVFSENNPFDPIIENLQEEVNADQVIAVLEEKLEALKNAKPATQPEPAPEQPAFREEYTFLKDPNCPDGLKILATDKITYYNLYQAAHGKLQQATTGELQLSEEEKLALANEAEENFAKNEAIKAELDHYRDQGEILGLHPLFKKLQAEREVASMSNDALHKFVTSTKTYVSRKNKDIKEAQSEDKRAELQQELDERLYKLSLVKKKLGLEDK